MEEFEFEEIQKEILETEHLRKVFVDQIQFFQKQLDEILLKLNERDDRTIDGVEIKPSLTSEVNKNIHDWISKDGDTDLEYDTELYTYLKNYFNVKDSELKLDELQKDRFELEFYRAALKIRLESIDKELIDLNGNLLVHYNARSKPWLYENDEEETEEEPTTISSVQGSPDDDVPDDGAPDAPEDEGIPWWKKNANVHQFQLINDLEKKLRSLLKEVLKQQDNWYENYIPKEIKHGLEKRNQKNPNFPQLLENESLELIDLLMFKDYQLIITSSYSQYELFKNIFPNIHYVTERLIEASIFRNQIAHSNELSTSQETTLSNITNEFIMHINEYLGIIE